MPRTKITGANHWRLRNQRYSLVGEACGVCGAKLFPPRDVCPEHNKPPLEVLRDSINLGDLAEGSFTGTNEGEVSEAVDQALMEGRIEPRRSVEG